MYGLLVWLAIILAISQVGRAFAVFSGRAGAAGGVAAVANAAADDVSTEARVLVEL